MPFVIKFRSLILFPFSRRLFCENICDICTLCEAVQNMPDISQGNKDQNLIFYIHSHGKLFLLKTIISCILIGNTE